MAIDLDFALEPRVGMVIQRLRMQKDWPLSVLADRAGISAMQLGRIERLESSPTEMTIRSLAKALGVRVSELFGESEYPIQREIAVAADRVEAILAKMVIESAEARRLMQRFQSQERRQAAIRRQRSLGASGYGMRVTIPPEDVR